MNPIINMLAAMTAGISPGQIAVARLVAMGATCKEIASDLGISHRTVEQRKKGICEKLDARNMTEAVYLLVKAGVI